MHLYFILQRVELKPVSRNINASLSSMLNYAPRRNSKLHTWNYQQWIETFQKRNVQNYLVKTQCSCVINGINYEMYGQHISDELF